MPKDDATAAEPIEQYLRARIDEGAPNRSGTRFIIDPSGRPELKAVYEALKAKLGPFVADGRSKSASFNIGDVPLTVTLDPTDETLLLALNGSFD